MKEIARYFIVTALLSVVSLSQGLTGSMAALFLIAPPTLLYLKHDRLADAVAVIALVTITVFLFAGYEGVLYYAYEFAVLNVFLLLVLKRESKITSVIFRSSVYTYLAVFFVVGSLAIIYNVNIHNVVSELVDSTISEIAKLYKQAELDAQQATQIEAIYKSITDLFKQIYPAIIFIGLEVIVTVNLLVLNRFFLKENKKFDTRELLNWSPNENLVWGVILFGFLLFVKNDYAGMVAQNGLIVFLSIYFFCGLCVANYFFRIKKVPVFVQMTLYFALIVISGLKYVLIGIGLFDIWFDFRKIKKRTT